MRAFGGVSEGREAALLGGDTRTDVEGGGDPADTRGEHRPPVLPGDGHEEGFAPEEVAVAAQPHAEHDRPPGAVGHGEHVGVPDVVDLRAPAEIAMREDRVALAALPGAARVRCPGD